VGERALPEAQELRLGYGESFALVLLGFAHLGPGDVPAALAHFERAARRLDEGPPFAWVWRMPLHLGLSACRLALGDAASARREAERVCEAAARSGERTYLALGRRAAAEA